MLQILMRKFSSFNYDLCVIGGGPGGYVSTIRSAQFNDALIHIQIYEGHTLM